MLVEALQENFLLSWVENRAFHAINGMEVIKYLMF